MAGPPVKRERLSAGARCLVRPPPRVVPLAVTDIPRPRPPACFPLPRFSTTVEISVQKGYGATGSLPSLGSLYICLIQRSLSCRGRGLTGGGHGTRCRTALWDDVLARVEGKVNRHSFATWFRPTTFLSQDGSTLRVGVPNAQFREWLSKNYLGVLQEAVAEAGQPGLRVSFEEMSEEPAAARAPPPRARVDPPQPEVHLRELRRRLLEPVRPRRRARRRRDPLEVLQPALHLRRGRPRQDPPHARDRPLHPGPPEAAQRRSTSRPTASSTR